MHQLRKIRYRNSGDNLICRDIADKSFDPGIGRYHVQESLSDKSFDILSFKRFVFSLFIQSTEFCIGNDRRRIEFDLIRFEIRISI